MREGKRGSGEEVKRDTARQTFSPLARRNASPSSSAKGWTLIELVITITVLTVLTLGIIPLVKTSVRRQKEVRLRDTLRQIRGAIDEFKRDTIGMQCGGIAGAGGAPPVTPPTPPGAPGAPGQVYVDPRSRVVNNDCTMFGVDNPDRYPPSLQALVDGVKVIPRGGAGAGGVPNINTQPTDNAAATSTKLKVYLREIPVDPITGKAEWCLRSSYETGDDCSSDPDNVFDVRSLAEGEALNGEKYRDW